MDVLLVDDGSLSQKEESQEDDCFHVLSKTNAACCFFIGLNLNLPNTGFVI